MRLIGLVVVVALDLVLGPLAAEAQPGGKVYRVGLVVPVTPVSDLAGPAPVHPATRAFVQELRTLGYVEGQNLVLERRSAEGRLERFGDIVAELIRLKSDAIVTVGTPAARVAKAATTTIPIVMATSWDPVSDGIVQSLARPGGNITGLTMAVGADIEAKRLELLRAMLPSISRVAYLGSKEEKDWESPSGESVRTAAHVLGVTLVRAEFSPHQYIDAFTWISRARAEAVFVSPSSTAYGDRALIVGLANQIRLPSAFRFREAVELGGLMSYGVNVADNFRRAAGYVDKILKGARPADLPVEQPTKFEFFVNLKAAKQIGLTIPPNVLARADRVIR